MPDIDKQLYSLHDLLCGELTSRLVNGEEAVTDAGEVVRKKASPATLSVIRQFLKDNKVDSALGKGKPLQALTDSLPDFDDDDNSNVEHLPKRG